MSCIPQWSVQHLVLLITFINSIGNGIKCSLSKFADYTKMHGASDTSVGRGAIERELDKTDK